MFEKLTILLLFVGFSFFSCQPSSSEKKSSISAVSPTASTFDASQSDPKAIEIAEQVMEAMGGQSAWDSTRYFTWSFFGRRQHYWDKQSGRVRIISPQDSTIWLMNVYEMTGQVQKGGKLIENPDSLQHYLQEGKGIWINDSYWLVMPFKLKDGGVRLKYLGKGETQAGNPSDILELTFEGVGDTPKNKYHVYVDENSHLVTEWAFYADASDTDPRFTLPWEGYKKYGNILLSGSRGKAQLSAISVYKNLPGTLFNSFDK